MSDNTPKGWEKSKLKGVVTYKKGKKPSTLKDEYFEDSIPYLDIRALEKGEVRQYAAIKDSSVVNAQSVAMVWDGARSGWVSKVDYGAMGSTIAALTPKLIDVDYLYHFLKSKFSYLNSNTRGTGIPHVDPSILWEIEIPIAPLTEQKRLVLKLDQAFKHIEILKNRLAYIPELLEKFRQTILSNAFAGKLTEEWRKTNGFKDWQYQSASNCCQKVQSGGTPKGSVFDLEGIPFLKVYNIVNQQINFNYRPQFVTPTIQNTQLKKSVTRPGDVIMNIVGPPLGKIAIVPDDYQEWNLNQAITLFRTKDYLLNTFLYYFFCEGTSVRSLANETKGVVGQVNISLSQCRSFNIPVPSLEEQVKIVNKIEELFSKTKKIEVQYKLLKSKIDKLPQLLLKRAFDGRFVEQNENDEPASELLKRIEQITQSLK